MLNRDVLRLMADSDGVVSRDELRSRGVSEAAIRRDVRRGVWDAQGRSALVAAGTARSLATSTRIICINRPSVVPTGTSAISLQPRSPWRMLIADQSVPWVIGRNRGNVGWLSISHPGARMVEQSGLWIADQRTALIDLIRFLPRKQAHAAAMIALQRTSISVEQMRASARLLVGYPGVEQLRTVILAVSAGAQSHGEHRLIRILQRAGITGWTANFPVRIGGERFVIDVAFPKIGLAIEFDGWAFHSDPDAFVRDRARQNALSNAGWLILRFTWSDLDAPEIVVRQIQAAIEARRAA